MKHCAYPLFRYFTAFMLGMGLSVSVFGQAGSPYRQLLTGKNIEVADTISGSNLDLNLVNPLAQHGNVSLSVLQTGGPFTPYIYRVVYTPDPGFVGVDTFALEYNYFGSFPYLIYQAFRVSVYPSLVVAKPDFAVAVSGQPILIPVLSNDASSESGLTLSTVTNVNNGTAIIVGDDIEFTPDANYTGIAHLTYNVCDSIGTCKNGFASVGVLPMGSLPPTDTLTVFTVRNKPLSVPLEATGYSLFQAPMHGAVLLSGSNFRYEPDYNYTGIDQMVLTHTDGVNPVYRTVVLRVLPFTSPNTMAVEDVVYTPRNQPISFNVRANDIGNLKVRGWIVPPNFPGTISGTTGLGNVTFTPNSNFSGVATFYYKLGNIFANEIEVGTVNVVVSNLNPSMDIFELTTPLATPLVINYDFPPHNYAWTVVDAPDHGSVQYYPGNTTQNINGQSVTGKNLLVYEPNANFQGVDEMEVRYCVTSNGQCKTFKVTVNVVAVFGDEAPYCVGNACVWPGDANTDGLVNNSDLLTLGYLMGAKGQPRDNASLEWYGQYAADWNDPYSLLPYDLKHADADGDGTITSNDTLPIGLFYQQYDQLTPTIPVAGKGLPFILRMLNPTPPTVGDLVEIEIDLGEPSRPVTNLHGFTFNMSLSPIIRDSAFHFDYYDNSWFTLNAPSLEIAKRPRTGRFETAITRTNGVSASGYGLVAKADYIIVEIIQGGRPISGGASSNSTMDIVVETNDMNGNGTLGNTHQFVFSIPVRGRSTDEVVKTHAYDLRVVPSPAADQVRIHLNGTDLMEDVTVVDLTGRIVWQANINLPTESLLMDVSAVPNGTYIAIARTSTGNVTRKFQVAH
jgi:Bacterial Ig domain/Secretion system C-terminal sorting domain